ncbi:MAG: aminotransferase class I/II-fold pyridoxal phosphate-dependent enzyme [Flavobacteriaceae bacterium]|jgi:8-amino-7-oxononanoate synthase|nr:aminotransferase class I/II-fold pyridoxal phosphate-dependent enzyme [Flavobacteriaceae bacterium]
MIQYFNKAIGPYLSFNKKSYLYFGGTSYLSLQTHYRFKRWLLKGILKYGAHHGASRQSNIRISLFEKVEKVLAQQTKAPRALLSSSGYLAGQMVAKQFLNDPFVPIYLPGTHSALKIDPKAVETHYDNLETRLNELLELKKQAVIFLDSIDFKGKHYPEFQPLKSMDLSSCILVVDDSHALGICGLNGAGSYEILKQLKPRELIVTASMGKGMGISGGVVLCEDHRAKAITASATYGGASPASLAGLYAYLEAPEIYQKQLLKLHKNTKRFIKGLDYPEFFDHHLGHPAFGFQSAQLSKELKEAGFVLTNFPYPTEKDPIMSRIVISAGHKKKDIESLCKTLNTLIPSLNK